MPKFPLPVSQPCNRNRDRRVKEATLRAHFNEVLRSRAERLAPHVGHDLFISTWSVYTDNSRPDRDEIDARRPTIRPAKTCPGSTAHSRRSASRRPSKRRRVPRGGKATSAHTPRKLVPHHSVSCHLAFPRATNTVSQGLRPTFGRITGSEEPSLKNLTDSGGSVAKRGGSAQNL